MGYRDERKPNAKARTVIRRVAPNVLHEKHFYPTDENGRSDERPIHRLHVDDKTGRWADLCTPATVKVDGVIYVRIFDRHRVDGSGFFTNCRKVYAITNI